MSRLSRSRISAACGAARMLRCPSARGPNSVAPSIHPTMRPAARSSATRSSSAGLVERLDALAVVARHARQLVGVHARAHERMVGHVAVGVLEVDAVGVERRAHRAAGVARRRRHEHALEAGFGEEARVGHAVQRDAAAEAQVGQTGLPSQRPRDVEQRVLEHALHAGGAVGEAAAVVALQVDRVVGMARRAEQIDERRRERPARARLVLEVLRHEREAAVGRAPDHLPHRVAERRPPVGGQPHHLVLAVVHREAEVGRERRIEHARASGETGSRA